MAALQEVVVAAASVDSPVCVWDLTTGSLLASLVSSASQRRGLCAMGRDHVAVSQLTRGESKAGAVNVWSWRKSAVAVRSPTSEAIGPLAATADGVYLCGGGVSGRVYVWEAATGRLLRVWAAHYRAVTCLALSDDDALLVSAGEDSIIHVTPLVRKGGAGGAEGSAGVQPMYTWQQHQQSITALWMAAGGVNSVLVSSSSDHSCKIWSLAMGALLRSYVFPVAITAAAMDPGEYTLYAGGADGNIYLTALNFTAVHGTAMDPMAHDDALVGHSHSITALEFSADAVSLVSASEDCTVRVWDTVTRQLLRTFTNCKGPVSCLLVLPKPPTLFPSADISRSSAPASARKPAALPPMPLHKYANAAATGLSGSEPWEEAPLLLPSVAGGGGGGVGGAGGVGAGLVPVPGSVGGEREGEEWGGVDGCYSSEVLGRTVVETKEDQSLVALQLQNARLLSNLQRANEGLRQMYRLAVSETMVDHLGMGMGLEGAGGGAGASGGADLERSKRKRSAPVL
ncbi:hypothetical protein CLOP_g23534 [Closterium sp. NIES-67]|nr:hypothetical protein CLOP_g23534 [Closterium sp. NIES-67]